MSLPWFTEAYLNFSLIRIMKNERVFCTVRTCSTTTTTPSAAFSDVAVVPLPAARSAPQVCNFAVIVLYSVLPGQFRTYRTGVSCKGGHPRPGALFCFHDPHIEKRPGFSPCPHLLDDGNHAVNGLLRCNRCSPYWRPHPRPPRLQYCRDHVIFYLARSVSDVPRGVSRKGGHP